MWVADYVIAVIERFDRCTDAFIRKIHGHQLARNLSVGMDRFYRESTLLVDRVCLGTRATHGYDPATTHADEEAVGHGAFGPGPSVAQARKFRRKYVKPRRRLARRADGGLRWEQLAAGENTAGSRTYQECDVPLSSLTEFGDGWVLYFWTVKMVGLISLLSLLIMAGSWADVEAREHESQREIVQPGLLNWVMSKLGSADCGNNVKVCMNDACSQVASRNLCPDPHPVNALSCVSVIAVYALFIVHLRVANYAAGQHVKNVEGDNGLRTENYSVMVENPPSDARDPDEWESFFSQFGKVAYVTVAKSDGDLVWKCLEPRQLMLMLYRDNPNELRDKIKVVSERVQKKPKRSSRFCYSRVETPDVEKTEEAFGDHHKVNVAHEQLDAGDEDADGGPNESMVAMAPWCTGGHLQLQPSLVEMAEALEGAGDNYHTVPSKLPLRQQDMNDPFKRYVSPYKVARWLIFILKLAFPHYLGTLSKQDRDMLAERLFRECPWDLKEELDALAAGKQYDAARIFVTFETIKSRRECLTALTTGGMLARMTDSKRVDIPPEHKFRRDRVLVVTEPPAPEQIIWWNLGVGVFQRFKDDVFSLFVTCLLIWASYTFALYVSSRDEDFEKEVPPKHPQYGKALGFAIWGQVYNQLCTNTFGWLASQLNNHDHDAAQLNLLLRYTLLKCVNSIIYIVVTPRASTLTLRSVSAMKMMLYADAVIGPMLRYIDIFSFIKRFFSRWLPNQPLMDWAHLAPLHDIADSYSNVIKTVFLGLWVLPIVPSAPLLTALACLTGYWVDKYCICRMWSCHSFEKPAKWTAEAAQNLLGIVLVVTMMNTIQLYKNWPFDNLCFDEESDPVISNDELWQTAGAVDGRVWSLCKQPSAFLLARWGLDGVGLIAKPEEWMTIAHSRALKIYSVFSIIITIVLFLYYWGRNILDLAKHLFFTKAIPLRPNEDNLPTFTDGGAGMSAYVPQVHDGSFMFPMLATDLSTMDTAQHIPWVCDYDLMNFANDLGPAAIAQGLSKAFSVVKRYGPISGSRPDSPESISASRSRSNDRSRTAITRSSLQGTLEVVPESRGSIDPLSKTEEEMLTLVQRGSAPAFIEAKIPAANSKPSDNVLDTSSAATDETKGATTEVGISGEAKVDNSIAAAGVGAPKQDNDTGIVEVGTSNNSANATVHATSTEERKADDNVASKGIARSVTIDTSSAEDKVSDKADASSATASATDAASTEKSKAEDKGASSKSTAELQIETESKNKRNATGNDEADTSNAVVDTTGDATSQAETTENPPNDTSNSNAAADETENSKKADKAAS